MSAQSIDRPMMARLSAGHMCADLCQGAVPALLPALIADRGLSLASATALVTVSTVGSSVVQPLFGVWSDRLSSPVLMPVGVALGGLGLGAVGLCHSYLALALALGVSGLGVALFHPEGARGAGMAAGGSARGMSYFSIGGNAGFALGPLLVLVALHVGGLNAAPLLALPCLVVAAVLARDARRTPACADDGAPLVGAGVAQWGPFVRLSAAAVSRTAAFFALQAFVPLYLISHYATGPDIGAIALTAMLAAGAVGTYFGGRLADRIGRRPVIVGAMLPLSVLLLAMPHLGVVAFLACLLAVGVCFDGPFATTVILGQEYLPGRAGLASGITLGLAIGIGGLLAAGLGVIADLTSIRTAIYCLPAFTLLALGLAITLPHDTPAIRMIKTA